MTRGLHLVRRGHLHADVHGRADVACDRLDLRIGVADVDAGAVARQRGGDGAADAAVMMGSPIVPMWNRSRFSPCGGECCEGGELRSLVATTASESNSES